MVVLMKKHTQGLVLSPRNNSYLSTFAHVKNAEQRLSGLTSERADELIEMAYAALNQALQTHSLARRSTLYLAARLAAGLSLQELVRAEEDNCPHAA